MSCFHSVPAIGSNTFLSICLCTLLLVVAPFDTYAQTETIKYPIKLPIITREQSHCNSPENTFSARISALLNKDLEWLYNTLTRESAERNRKAFADANMDPSLMFQMVSPEDQIFILDKFNYKEGIALLVQNVGADGGILTGAVIFVQEDGLWKQTSAFNSDEPLSDFTTVVLPESILTADIEMFPSQWKLNKHFADDNEHLSKPKNEINSNTVRCIIRDIRDNEGNTYPITDIDVTTLLLNYQLRPVSVKQGKLLKGQEVESRLLPKEYTLLKEWEAVNKSNSNFQGNYLAVRFDQKAVLETLGEFQPARQYQINITGILGDEIHFRGESTITIDPGKGDE